MDELRLMVADAVMQGLIGEEHLLQSEIDELFERCCDLATEQLMIEAEARGCSIFHGIEGDTLQ